ncbi:MAG TPA: thioesterase family protein [Acidimicrobiales bacterium]|nr:thioesterase family protein [Acidimicrobiales bacterium]
MTKLDGALQPTDFDRTTAVVPIDGRPGEFAVELDVGWSSLVGVHGGYMCAIAVRGAEALVDDRSVRTLTTSFLRTGQVGSATLSVHAVREGRSFSTMVADLVQDGRLLLTARLTLMVDREGVEWQTPSPIDLPDPEECTRMEGGRVVHFERVDGVLDPRCLPFSGSDRARIQGYVRPLEPRTVDAAWLAMVTDWFPPPAFLRIEPPTGGVSIDLTTHIHQTRVSLDDGDWLTGAFEIETSSAGLATEHGRIARRDGTLVAESFQTRLMTQG